MDPIIYAQNSKIQGLLSCFNDTCSKCGRKHRLSYIESYVNGKYNCKECKSKMRLLNIPLPFAMARVARYFGINQNELKTAISNNIVLKNAMLSYLEGIGRYGVRTPQPMGAPFFVILSVIQKCNLRCSFCYNDEYIQNNNPAEMSNENVKKVIDQLSEVGCLGIGFNGGEPTLRKDIYEIISYAKSKNLVPLIATNAISIDENNASKLKRAGLLYAQVSLDGNKETHEKLRGRKGCYDEAINGIENLINQGIYISVALLATKKNYNEINHVLKIAKKYGASKFEVIDYQTIGKADENLDLNPEERDKLAENLCKLWKDIIKNKERISLLYKNPAFVRSMKKTFTKVETIPFFGAAYPKEAKQLFKYSKRFNNGIFSVQDPFSPIATCCEAGLFGLFIDVDGSITPCPYMPLTIGNIKDDNVYNIWKNSEVLNNLRDKNNVHEPCFSCENRITCGGCRARAFNITGDYLSADPLCSNVTRK